MTCIALSTGKGPTPTAVVLSDGCAVTRRVIPSDNSCLFTAVGYTMEHDRTRASALRRVIADAVAGDPGAPRGADGAAAARARVRNRQAASRRGATCCLLAST